MNKLIVLLRGVNIGSNQLKMSALRDALTAAGFEDVETYIQSGNVLLRSEEDVAVVSARISELISTNFGLDIPALTLTQEQLKATLAGNPYPTDQGHVYFTYLLSEPQQQHAEALAITSYPGEHFTQGDGVIYFYPENGYGRAKLNNNVFEQKLQVAATTRNYKTMSKLLDMAKL